MAIGDASDERYEKDGSEKTMVYCEKKGMSVDIWYKADTETVLRIKNRDKYVDISLFQAGDLIKMLSHSLELL